MWTRRLGWVSEFWKVTSCFVALSSFRELILRQLLPWCLYEMGLGRMEWQRAKIPWGSMFPLVYDCFGPALVRSGSCNVDYCLDNSRKIYLFPHRYGGWWSIGLTSCIICRSLFPKSVTLTVVFVWFSVYICLVLYLTLCFVSLLLTQHTSLLGPFGALTSQARCCYHLTSDSSYSCSHGEKCTITQSVSVLHDPSNSGNMDPRV